MGAFNSIPVHKEKPRTKSLAVLVAPRWKVSEQSSPDAVAGVGTSVRSGEKRRSGKSGHMPHSWVSKDLGPDPEFLIHLMKMPKRRGLTTSKVTQQSKDRAQAGIGLSRAPALGEGDHVQAERVVVGVSTRSWG